MNFLEIKKELEGYYGRRVYHFIDKDSLGDELHTVEVVNRINNEKEFIGIGIDLDTIANDMVEFKYSL